MRLRRVHVIIPTIRACVVSWPEFSTWCRRITLNQPVFIYFLMLLQLVGSPLVSRVRTVILFLTIVTLHIAVFLLSFFFFVLRTVDGRLTGGSGRTLYFILEQVC